jgi:outer membrane receptor protein involved in Fe transport
MSVAKTASFPFLLALVLAPLTAQGSPASQAAPDGAPSPTKPGEEAAAADEGAQPAATEGSRRDRGPRIVVTAFRRQVDGFETPRSISLIDREVLLRRSETSVLDSLDRTIGIWIEKRTATTSDPVLRGLSGGNLLSTIDGNSLTTFWGEGGFAGDDMYGKVEPESIERIEVIRGPASVQYGSNALGGVINFVTRKASLPFPDEGLSWGGRFKASFETVNQGKMLRVDGEAATPDFRFRVGGTWRNVEDGEGGSDVGTLAPSGGREYNVDLAAEYRTGADGSHVYLEAQQVRRRDIARYYRPTQRNENDRYGLTAGWRSADRDADNLVQASFYYQWKQDRRYWDDGRWGYASYETYATDLLLRSDEWLPQSRSVAGATVRMDRGQSPDDEEFTMVPSPGVREKASPDAEWYDVGVFFESETDLTDWLTLTLGLRYDYFRYKSYPDSFYSSPGGNNDVDRLDEDEHSLTGGVGLLFKPGRAVARGPLLVARLPLLRPQVRHREDGFRGRGPLGPAGSRDRGQLRAHAQASQRGLSERTGRLLHELRRLPGDAAG